MKYNLGESLITAILLGTYREYNLESKQLEPIVADDILKAFKDALEGIIPYFKKESEILHFLSKDFEGKFPPLEFDVLNPKASRAFEVLGHYSMKLEAYILEAYIENDYKALDEFHDKCVKGILAMTNHNLRSKTFFNPFYKYLVDNKENLPKDFFTDSAYEVFIEYYEKYKSAESLENLFTHKDLVSLTFSKGCLYFYL